MGLLYIPLYDKDNPENIVAICEIYSNVTPFLQQLDRTQRKIIITSVLILGSLYSLLFAIVRHAERILKRQHSELRESENRAKSQALKLEQTLHQLQETQTQLIHSEKINAIDALEKVKEQPTISIRTEILSSPSLFVLVRIADNGEGIPDAVYSKIFDPFFTTKPIGKGTGLGLTICHQIVVKEHGGRLICRSGVEGGTEFVVQLPVDAVLCEENSETSVDFTDVSRRREVKLTGFTYNR